MQEEKINDIPVSQFIAQKLTKQALEYKKLQEGFSKRFSSDNNNQFYILSIKWLNQWKKFVSYDEIVANKEPSMYFGKIKLDNINDDLKDDVKRCFHYIPIITHQWNQFIKQDLQENVDYVIIDKDIWEFFINYYASTIIIRTSYGNGINKQVAVNLLRFKCIMICPTLIKRKYSGFKNLFLQADRSMKLKDYYALIQETVPSFQADLVQCNSVRIWRYITDQNDIYQTFYNEVEKQLSQLEDKDDICIDFIGELLTYEQYEYIEDVGIIDTNLIVFEFKENLKPWCIRNQAVQVEGKCQLCQAISVLYFPCVCKKVAYCKEECKQKDYDYHSSICEKHGSDDESIKSLTIISTSVQGIVGLSNLGNTSFMNSGTQCISNSYPLVEYFLKNLYFNEINMNNPLGTKGQLVKQVGLLIKKMWCGESKTITPTNYQKAIGQFQPMFKGYHQHDSSELIAFILDGIHEDLNRVKKKPYIETKDYDGRSDFVVAKESWLNHLVRNQSIIVDLMHGQYKTTFKCPTCQQFSIYFDPYLMVQLIIPSQKEGTISQNTQQPNPILNSINQNSSSINVSLYDCLQYSQLPENLNLENTWYCKVCKEHVQALKSMQIYKAPQILIFTLQRYKPSNSLFKQKLETLVDFPINNLDMTDYVINSKTPNEFQDENQNNNGETNKQKVIYDLYAVSNHFGGLDGGHYTAFAKNKFTNKWYNFDDSMVSQMSESSVVSKSAFVLCYQLRTDDSNNSQEKIMQTMKK